MRRWARALAVVRRLLPFIVAFLRDRRRWILFGRPVRRSDRAHRRRSKRLAGTIAALGPTFIKLAQVFSARADVLPEPYLSAIGRLQDRVPPEPVDAVEAIIETELGASVDELFESFDREPAAAASLAQVHRARTAAAPPGDEDAAGEVREVAVKVLRPAVERTIALDLDISFRVLFVLNILFQNHHIRALTNVIREFSVRIREEMDFRSEAAHVALFQRHFERDERVRAPRVYSEFTRRRVLVMEWVEADKVDALAGRFASGDLEFDELMDTLTETYLRMLLVEGVLHADPHPGNILLEPDGTIVFLDWGMVVQLDKPTRERIVRLALAAARGDVSSMINSMYELGMIDPDVSRAEVREAAVEIMGILERIRELGIRRAQEMVRQVMDTFYTWPLILPQELVYFFRAAALLEGIGFRYDPNFSGIEVARPVIRRMRAELLRAAGREPLDTAKSAVADTGELLRAARDVILRAEREEFRVRAHPRDVVRLERLLRLQVRRVMLSAFALAAGVVSAIVYLVLQNPWILLAGLAASIIFFLVVLLIPTHLLENPLRHARGLEPPSV